MTLSQSRALLLGLSVADALGVPVEFQSRKELSANPVTGVRGYGTHDQPPGTFSDDSTMAFCLAETIAEAGGKLPLNYRDLANRFINWCDRGYWTPHGVRFDIGRITWDAIQRLKDQTLDPTQAGGAGEYENGNGSLMRILPLVRLTPKLDPAAKLQLIREVSGMTHAHPRSVLCCLYYVLLAEELLKPPPPINPYPDGYDFADKREHFRRVYIDVNWKILHQYLPLAPELAAAASHLTNLTDGHIATQAEASIYGDGYVVNSLKASVWCLFQTDSYASAVLRAINLGEDTDTTACITGGLAALLYGEGSIPEEWLAALVRRADIEELAERFSGIQSAQRSAEFAEP